MPPPANRIAIVLLTLSLLCACGRPPADRRFELRRFTKAALRSPAALEWHFAQPVADSIRYETARGNAHPNSPAERAFERGSHAGDTFSATVDEPVVIDGQTLVARGTRRDRTRARSQALRKSLAGRSRARSPEPGYLRIVLVSLNLGGKPVTIETSSIFVKGGSREERKTATGAASGASQKDSRR